MKPGTKLRCIDAKERGIPITEGQTYTVLDYARDGDVWGDGSGPHVPGVELRELPNNFFRADRFEVIQ